MLHKSVRERPAPEHTEAAKGGNNKPGVRGLPLAPSILSQVATWELTMFTFGASSLFLGRVWGSKGLTEPHCSLFLDAHCLRTLSSLQTEVVYLIHGLYLS